MAAQLTQTSKIAKDPLSKKLTELRTAHIENLRTLEATGKHKVGYHHSRTMKRMQKVSAVSVTIRTSDASSSTDCSSNADPARPPQPAVATANAISQVLSSLEGKSLDSILDSNLKTKRRIRKPKSSRRPEIIPALLAYADIEQFIRRYATAHSHCLNNATRGEANQIPKTHHSQDVSTAYRHMLDFYRQHPTRLDRKAWLLALIKDYGLGKKRWCSTNVWPLGDEVLVCRQCFCSMHSFSQNFVSRKMKDALLGSESTQHGNKGGAGRDRGMKTMQIETGLNGLLKRTGCDFMPHKNAVRTEFATRREMTAEVRKVRTKSWRCVVHTYN